MCRPYCRRETESRVSDRHGGDGVPPGNITIGPNGSPILTSPGTTAAANDHDKIRAALLPLGIPSTAIAFSRPDSSGNSPDPSASTMQVEVPVAQLPKIATAVVAAIGEAGVKLTAQGLRFAVLDCTAALSTARNDAVADAHKRAQGLATAAGVTLGALTSVTEQPLQASPLSYLSSNGQSPCGRSSVAPDTTSGNVPMAALDAKPEVELTESISVSYALGATGDRTIAAVGDGEVSGPADAADIVVLPSSNTGFSSPLPTLSPSSSAKIDRTRVLHALMPLGLATKDVEVENPNNLSVFSGASSSSYVRVHVTVARLAAIGTKIVSAVRTVVGADAASGVIFSASNCSDLLARARAAAAADAGKRLDKLAVAAHVKAGGIVGVAEVGTNVYFPSIDPCHPDLDSVVGNGLLSALASGSSGGAIPTLSGLDATPKVTEQVSLSINRALSSS
jgi:uncharacterized protein YggE